MNGESNRRECPNCRQGISLTGYEVHVTRCWRFTSYCTFCEEPVPTDELESHNEEFHTPKLCLQCNQSVAPGQAEQHQDECLEGMVLCKYCDLEKKRKDYSEHVEACGSRTEVCEKCSLRVILKDMQEHLAMKCGHVRSEPPLDRHTLANLHSFDSYTPSNFDPPSYPHTIDPPSHTPINGEELDEHWMESVGGVCADELDSLVAQNMFYLHATQAEPPPQRLSPASPPDTDADLELARRLQEEEVRRDRAFEMDQTLARQLQEDESSHTYTSHTPTPPPTYMELRQRTQDEEKRINRHGRDLEFASQPQPEEFLLSHPPRDSTTHRKLSNEDIMGPEVSSDEEFARRLQLEEDKFQYSTARSLPYSQSRTGHTHSLPTTDDLLPCQFCGQVYPTHHLTLHQNSCREGRESDPKEKDHITGRATRGCVYCGLSVPELDCSVHEALCVKNPDAYLNNVYPGSHPLSRTPSPPTLSHMEISGIPCEICGELFPLSDIHKHETTCVLKSSHKNSGRISSKESSSHTTILAARPSPQTSSSAARPSYLTQGTKSNPRAQQSLGGRTHCKLAIRFPGESGLSVSGRAISSKKPNGHTHM